MLLPKTYTDVTGHDRNRERIWTFRNVIEEGGSEVWMGTGRNELFMMWPTLRQALDYFIGAYPGTDGVDLIIGGGPDIPARYDYIDLAAAARKKFLDGILEKIGHVPPATHQGQDPSN